MKRAFLFFVAVLLTASVFAQTPEKMSYQAVIRNSSNALVTNTTVGIRISILQGSASGTVVYTETQTPTTNANGLVSIVIGGGAGFSAIDWANNIYFIKTETDPAGGTNYSIAGTSQLLSVPYALNAKTAESANYTETDPIYTAWNKSYDDLTNKPILFDGNYNSLASKPTLFDGKYNSLINKPSIVDSINTYGFSGHYADLINKPNNVSNFINDAGYLTTFSEIDPKIGSNTSGYSPKWDGSSLVTGAIYQDATGRVSIGKTNPQTTLDITSTNTTDAVIRLKNYNDDVGAVIINTYNAVQFGLFNPNATALYQVPANSGRSFFGYDPTGKVGSLTNYFLINNYRNLLDDGNGNASFSGNVSIGTTSPTAKLEVNGSVKIANGTQGANKVLTSDASGLASWQTIPAESQTLSINHDTISLTNGGKVKLPNNVSSIRITNDSLYIQFAYGQMVNAGYVGNGKTGSTLSSVVTSNTTDINYVSTNVEADITNSGNELVLSRGVCLSKHIAPGLNDTVYFSGAGSGVFTVNCINLVPNTTYHLRAFATNSVGTSYGNELTFTTKGLSVPTITTQDASNITNTTAISGANITNDGGTAILGRGICWSQSANPTTSDNHTTEGLGIRSFISLMTGLTSDVSYHVRAYANNAQGTSYGNDISFTTIVYQMATITTTAASNISYTTATSGGNVSNDNGSPVTGRGICWATTSMPTTSKSNYTENGGLGSFNANMTGLTANTTYYIRAFAVNGGGTSYGNQISITTLAPSLASITTKSISGISSNIAGSGGTISTDGGSTITAKGVCWSLNTNPTLSNYFTTDGTGVASYNSTMSGLNPLTNYYVRAYATNGLGTIYSNEISFTTTDLVNPGPTVPVIGTSASSMATSSTANSGGYVSFDGGSTVTVRGVCWSTNQNPTLADNFSTDGGTGLGYFSSTITGLGGCGNIYYVRAYATNSTGTAYGNQNTVSTGLLPTVTTSDISSIDYYTAVSGGSITDDGGCPITQKGVCWNYSTGPTISNPHTSEGAGNGAFVSNITGLYANRTYYVRTYATNSVGTIYGSEKVFTTATPSSPYIGQNYAGGIVFYVDGTGQHGLVCASSDQGGGLTWGCQGTDIPTGTAVGTGQTNTAAIVASCTTAGIAAKICDDLVLNSYSDWFLPSLGEISLMRTNLYNQGFGNFNYYYYWTSSQDNANNAVNYYFNDGSYFSSNKTSNRVVRAIRAF